MRPGKRAALLAAVLVATATLVSPASAVVGGVPVPEGELPFVARIDIGDHERRCTGALIDPFWVVTAKSCFTENGQVRLSTATATIGRANAAQTSGVVREIQAVVPRDDRDVALLKLKHPVMEIATNGVGGTAGASVEVPGFGQAVRDWTTEQLHTAEFAVDSATGTSFAITGESKGLCRGDAGAPLLNAAAQIVGVGSTSWQGGCFGVRETRTGATGSRLDNIQDWIGSHVSARTVMFKNNFTGRCMLHWSGNTADGSPVNQFDCHAPYYDQAWQVTPVAGGHQLRNGLSDRCVSARTANDTYGTQVWAKDCAAGNTLQVWQVVAVTGGVQIRNAQTGLCLAVWHGTPDNGAPVTEQVCEPAYADQVWTEFPARRGVPAGQGS
jgi:hypothetical protein